jgi:hypothetical protein
MKKIQWTRREIGMLLFSGGICFLFIGLSALYQWNNRVPQIVIKQAKPPSPNAFDYFQQAAAAYVPPARNGAGLDAHLDSTLDHLVVLFSPEYSRRYPLASKSTFLKSNAKSLRLLRQGLKYSYLQPPERDGKDNASYDRYFDLARLLLLESHARAQAGNGAEQPIACSTACI